MDQKNVAGELIVRNPYSEVELGRLKYASLDEARQTLSRASEAFRRWRTSSAWERHQLLNAIADQLERRKAEFSQLISAEAGKPIQLAQGEVDRGLGVLRWAAAETQRFAGELVRIDAGATGRPGFGLNTRFPRGVVLGITPFNFPLNLVLHKIAPALACGCSILIKPSPYAPLVAIRLVEMIQKLVPDLPGLVQVICARDDLSEEMTRASEVAMISFTGSARVGWMIRKQAPEKATALELGGNAWVVVMPDTSEADLAAIAKRISGAAYAYAGQSCISVQNVAVCKELWPKLRDSLAAATENVPFGNPESASVISGPVINSGAAERIRTQLSKAPQGSQLVTSKKLEGELSRALVSPSLVMLPPGELSAGSLSEEEIFGPVMVARRFDSVDQVVRAINSSRYGLQAGVYTQHWPTIERLYRDLEVGGLVINDVPTTRYDHQPYGGVKESGQGREGVRYAMEDMTESKFLALSSRIPS